MRLKTIIMLVVMMVAGVIFSSYFIGAYLTTQVVAPFSTLKDPPNELPLIPTVITGLRDNFSFINADLQQGWIPWIIKQVSILIGGLSLVVFVYAGVSLIIYGDNEEQLGKSSKMIVFGVVGIGLAAFSYSIVANLLNIFS